MTEKIIHFKVDLFKHYNPFRKSSSLGDFLKYVQNNKDGVYKVDLFQETPVISIVGDETDDFAKKLELAIDRLDDFNLGWEQVDELTRIDIDRLYQKYSKFKGDSDVNGGNDKEN